MFGHNLRKVLTNGRFNQGRLAKTAVLACFLANELIATKTQVSNRSTHVQWTPYIALGKQCSPM